MLQIFLSSRLLLLLSPFFIFVAVPPAADDDADAIIVVVFRAGTLAFFAWQLSHAHSHYVVFFVILVLCFSVFLLPFFFFCHIKLLCEVVFSLSWIPRFIVSIWCVFYSHFGGIRCGGFKRKIKCLISLAHFMFSPHINNFCELTCHHSIPFWVSPFIYGLVCSFKLAFTSKAI